jgi:hypothetical protein
VQEYKGGVRVDSGEGHELKCKRPFSENLQVYFYVGKPMDQVYRGVDKVYLICSEPNNNQNKYCM